MVLITIQLQSQSLQPEFRLGALSSSGFDCVGALLTLQRRPVLYIGFSALLLIFPLSSVRVEM